MKKFFSLVLALVMALSLTTVAWGATTYEVNTAADLKDKAAAATNGDVIKLTADITIAAEEHGSVMSSISGQPSIELLYGIEVVNAGVTIDGNGHTLTVTGAYKAEGGQHCAVFFHGGTLQNIKIVGGNRCVYITNVGADVVFDNVVIDTEGSYGFNVNDGTAPTYELKATDSVFSGWNSYGTAISEATFTNCDFVENAAGICVLRPYNTTVVEDCNFAESGEIRTVELENVTVDGEPVTAANLSTLLGTTHTDVAVTSVATTSYNVYDANDNLVVANTSYDKVAGKVTNKKAGIGYVTHYTIDKGFDGVTFVALSAAQKGRADFYLTYTGQDDAILYLQIIPHVDYVTAKPYKNIGDECGMLSVNDESLDYFVVTDADGNESYYVEDEIGTMALMVSGKMVNVFPYGTDDDLVPHDWAVLTVDEDHEVTSLKCEECKVVVKVYATKLAAPEGAVYEAPYGWIAVPSATAPSTDKVTSAETFDAGIAMYVGMSVMAAAGSAVVIGKKKD